MRQSILALAAYLGLVYAQNETLEFFWPHAADYQDPAVTVKTVNPSTTIFHVACPDSTTSANPTSSNYVEDCHWQQGMDYTIFNISTYEATVTGSGYAMTRSCLDKGQGRVLCYAEGMDEVLDGRFIMNESWGAQCLSRGGSLAYVDRGGVTP
ncbi:hypothetical protein EKO04_008520 [Ascochyta lentis]|uniref:Uncharacterized protein n=1 Tax=Ascochyta lentis TaxID=205686 RepID=A0A8H7MCB0_9PLEO|nr:hypothetical protein EKO04_008520 [Ascochyta lentis]